MTAALQLPLHDVCITAVAFAAMLLNFASGDVANRALLASKEAVLLMGKLLSVNLDCHQSIVRLQSPEVYPVQRHALLNV